MKKKIVLYVPDATSSVYLPLLWASAKSYYELKGSRINEYEWIDPSLNYEYDTEILKQKLLEIKPDIFGISMYVWNDIQCLEIAKWIREVFPKCLIISGGPQQYFKHKTDWFEKYPFLDARLAGDYYGELSIADILDNLRPDNTVDWNLVNGVVYPSKNKQLILKSKKEISKKEFFWDYSPYEMQRETFLAISKEVIEKYKIVDGKLETTRGCPYSCTFCDWGGGTGTKVIQKSVANVFKDIDVIEECGVSYVFLCDANFGIMKDRDISIMQYIADKKKKNPKLFHLYFGGFAKSEKHKEYIKKILDLDAQNNITWDVSYKASIQSIHKDVLKNIERTDIPFETHVELAEHLKDNYGFSSYAECISGLPGITPDKWYEEINVYAKHDMDICLYYWNLLPETPSYHAEYRERMGMITVDKYNNQQQANTLLRKSEVVVGTYSYTTDDYTEMWLAFSIQRGFWATGFLQKVIDTILKESSIGYGDFIKLIVRDFFKNPLKSGKTIKQFNDTVDTIFNRYYDPNDALSMTIIPIKDVSAPMVSAFMLLIYHELENFEGDLKIWLLQTFPYLKDKFVQKELDLTITFSRIGTRRYKALRSIKYMNDILAPYNTHPYQNFMDYLFTQMETYTQTKFLRGRVIGI